MEDVKISVANLSDDEVRCDADPILEEITQAVRAATGGRVHNFKVEVVDATVQLKGFCATFHCNQLAQTAAMEIAGDMHVENQIVVW